MNLCNDNMIIYTCHMLEIIKKKINICIDPFFQIKKYLLKNIKENEKKCVYIKYHAMNQMTFQLYNEDGKVEKKDEKKDGKDEMANQNFMEKINHYIENNYVIIFKGLDKDLLQLLCEKYNKYNKSFVENIYIFVNISKRVEYIKKVLENEKNILYVYCDYKKNNVLNLFSYYYQKHRGNYDDVKNLSIEKENHIDKVCTFSKIGIPAFACILLLFCFFLVASK
ncbi:hypothetical protein [Plasmodium yoelii yoelii]|uniref:Uncharacterized protein n=1 Tax=Plasmodium yoelii yoelii TaxID=73239 RepID=Q7RJ74_PLAYO|nr:hypothetical protein [Plasmodium yoelii yoelii]